MTDKNAKLTKRVSNLIWLISLALLVTFFVALVGVQGVSDKVTNNPQNYPEDWAMIGLGIITLIIYAGIFQALFLLFSIPTSILKKKSLTAGRTSVADLVLTIILALIGLPAVLFGIYFVILTIELLLYGLAVIFLPYAFVILLHILVEALLITQLIKCWPRKQKV